MKREDLPALSYVLDPISGEKYVLSRGRAITGAEITSRPAYVGEQVQGIYVDHVAEVRIPAARVPETPWQTLEKISIAEQQAAASRRITDNPRSAEDLHD